MAKTVAEFTMSLDGFIAMADDDVKPLFGWYFAGDTEVRSATGGLSFKVSQASAALLDAEWSSIGALVTGRRDFDVSAAWGGTTPFGTPGFIVTHAPPEEWSGPGSPFIFVTDGVASAIEQARQAAGNKIVAVSGSQITRQAIQSGLVDELLIHLAPVLLGSGVSLFGQLGTDPINLDILEVIEGTGVTHIRYRVLK